MAGSAATGGVAAGIHAAPTSLLAMLTDGVPLVALHPPLLAIGASLPRLLMQPPPAGPRLIVEGFRLPAGGIAGAFNHPADSSGRHFGGEVCGKTWPSCKCSPRGSAVARSMRRKCASAVKLASRLPHPRAVIYRRKARMWSSKWGRIRPIWEARLSLWMPELNGINLDHLHLSCTVIASFLYSIMDHSHHSGHGDMDMGHGEGPMCSMNVRHPSPTRSDCSTNPCRCCSHGTPKTSVSSSASGE